MRLQKDLREFIESLNSNAVDYVIVGAFALAFHGLPRYTGDIDVLVRVSPENCGYRKPCRRPEPAAQWP
jgi:hypothetical protein